MKYLVIITVTLVLIQITNTAVPPGDDYDEGFDYGDDADPNVGFEQEEEQSKPIYNLANAPSLFEKFIIDYMKNYKNKEDKAQHYDTFLEGLKEINRINSDREFSSVADINLFTDLSKSERSLFLGAGEP